IIATMSAVVNLILVYILSGVRAENVFPKVDLPCPSPEDIAPCTCTVSSIGQSLTLVCNDVAGDEELEQVFHATFPYPYFSKLLLFGNQNIHRIKNETFQNVTFETMEIHSTTLEFIESGAFKQMSSSLKELKLYMNQLSDDFPFYSLEKLEILEVLDLGFNQITIFPVLEIPSIKEIVMSHNLVGGINPDTFSHFPKLEEVVFNNNPIKTLPTEMFNNHTKLTYINFWEIGLTELKAGTFDLSTDTLSKLGLAYNNISHVEPGTFKGVSKFSLVYMENNNLTALDEDVYGEMVADDYVQILLSNSPLKCDTELIQTARVPAFR
ncbi:unnamed protein product, partial [Meganyctiphanes norvegica]